MRFDSATLVANTIVSGSFEITGTTMPGDDLSYDLGTASKRWRSVYSSALTGSLTKLSTGGDYLLAGAGISLSTGSSGAVTITATVAGSSLIGGSNTQVQFNDNNTFGGSNLLTFNKVTGALTGAFVVASNGFSGSLTKLSNGSDYLVAGTGISLTTGSSGNVTIASTAVTSPGGLDTHVQFKDGSTFGGNSGLTYNKTTQALTGTYIVASTGFSGSLTKLSTGGDYLIAGTGIQLTTGSTGNITITSTVAGSSLVAGSNTQVQFNNGGTFGADSNFTFNSTTDTLSVPNISGSLTRLTSGEPYIVGTGGIVITTGSNGAVTMSLGTSTYTTASFTNATSVLVNHAMGTTIYDIEVFDTSYSKIIPMTATATTPTQANITFAIPTSGFIAVGGPTSGVSGAGLLQSQIYVGVNNATQTNAVQDTPINIQTTLYSLGNEITRPTNSRFTVSGPGTYRLQAVIGLVDSAQNYSGYQWYNVTNSTYVGTVGYAEDNGGASFSSTMMPVAYVTVSSPTTYELRQAFGNVTVTNVYSGCIQVEITKVTGFTSALGLTQTVGNAPYYGARAWVNFNGTGTVAIRASQNISSITDNGVGSYTLNFTVPMEDSNFVVMGTSEHDNGTSVDWAVIDGDVTTASPSNSSVRVNFLGNNSAMRDSRYCFFTIFR